MFFVYFILFQVNSSDDHFVILKNASSATNGKYKCVVSAEEKFKTLYDTKDITVVGKIYYLKHCLRSFMQMNLYYMCHFE